MKKALLALVACGMLSVTPVIADENTVGMLNELLRGELSAVETYNQALEKIGTEAGADKIRKARDEHKMAVDKLTALVRHNKGTPVTSSGPWGAWAQAVTGTAKVLGNDAAMKVLKEGEEHGIKEYQEALENDNVPVEIKALIKDTLLPKQKEHIVTLDSLMARG